ncbi:C-C motif chemokine 20-like [Hippoglossus stenolepis]|uniref:C-C motif chemokine 20-like n=1 Tax=Hippoglossus stenolepis TaxID=195615 RepID=UPI00159C7F05|nr:C-C motif chemokine 20-like [Hippoglossus stenolepis]
MAPRGTITMTTALLCFILGLLSPAPATSCCTRYNRKPVPFQRIKGYREQTIRENCNMEAIIFYTIKKNEICVTRRDAWVKKTLELLSSKLKKMSKPNSAAGGTLRKKKKSGNPSYTDRSGSFFSTTETFLNNTESFY